MDYTKLIICLTFVVFAVALNVNSAPTLDELLEREGISEDALEDEPQVKRGAYARKDVLSAFSCRYIRLHTDFCKSHPAILDKLCYATCRCNNTLSEVSCNILKGQSKCGNYLVAKYCRLTCNTCIKLYYG